MQTPVPISSLDPPTLVAALVACAAGLLVFGESPLALPLFLAQRLVVVALLWPLVPPTLAVTVLVSSLAALAIAALSECQRVFDDIRLRRLSLPPRSSLSRLALRVASATLALLLVDGLVHRIVAAVLPLPAAYAITTLAVAGLILILLADESQKVSLGILSLIDAARLLYALWQANPLVWGLWAACDVLVAATAARLRAPNPTATEAEEPL